MGTMGERVPLRLLAVLVALLLAITTLVATPPRAGAAGPDTAKYIHATYQLFLGRNATSGDINHWDSTVDLGRRPTFTAALAASNEWAGVRINGLYKKILRRSADANGRAYWLGRIQRGHRLEDIAALFYGSEEYWNRSSRSPSTFVNNLYRDLLGRPSDAAGRQYWVGRLQSGLTRSKAASGFYASTESRTDRVTTLYREVLNRNPDKSGLVYWRQRLLTLGDISLSSWLAASDEFYRRVTGVAPPAPGVIRLRGSNDRTFRVDLLGPTIVRSRHRGPGNFIIELQDGSGRFAGLGANEIGSYRGEQYVGFWRDTRFIEVTAGGDWWADLIPLRYASRMNIANGSGSTDHVKRVSVGSTRLTRFRYSGSSNFIVVAYDGAGEYLKLLVNEIGSTNVTRTVPAGTEFLEIVADGPWTTR